MKKFKVPKRIPTHISHLCNHLDDLFDLSAVDRSFSCMKEDTEDRLSASVVWEEDYQRLHITFYPLFFRQSRQQQRQDLLHEYCHTLTQPLLYLLDEFKKGMHVTPQQIKVQSERVTSRAANILDLFLTNNYHKKKKAYAVYLTLPKKRVAKKKR